MRTRVSMLAVLLVAAGCQPGPRTEIYLSVTADAEVQAALGSLRIRVLGGPDSTNLSQSYEEIVPAADLRWPIALAIVPIDGDSARTFVAETSALDGAGGELVVARVGTGFVPGETRLLRVHLEASCLGAACAEGSTCSDGMCTAVRFVDPTLLPPFTCVMTTFFADVDGDGYGDPLVPTAACDAPAGTVDDATDCNDACADCHPGASEVCGDAEDEDCSGALDDGCTCPTGMVRPCGTDEGACVVGSQTCTGDAWGSCDGAVGPSAEQCNGLDDDCDGAIDGGAADTECSSGPNIVSAACTDGACALACSTGFSDCTSAPGCESDLATDPSHCGDCMTACIGECVDGSCAPPHLLLTPTDDTALHGNINGVNHVDDCPPGQIMTGIEARVASGYYAGTLTQYRTYCSVATIVDSGGVFSLTTSPGAVVPETETRGSYGGGTLTSRSCPPGQVIVGFEGREGSAPASAVDAIALRCAPLLFNGATITIGTVSTLAAVGSSYGTAFGATDCPAGAIARGAGLSSGEILDRYSLRCAFVSLGP